MGDIVRYKHHNAEVAVDKDLQGKHRSHCLCFRCSRFSPEEREKNYPRANLLYAYCVAFDMVTPVYECPVFEETQ